MEQTSSIRPSLPNQPVPEAHGGFRSQIEVCLTVFSAYLLVAIPSLFFGATLSVWPAAGVAFAAGYLRGIAGAIGIFWGTLAANFTWTLLHHQEMAYGVLGNCLVALGNGLGALAAGALLSRLFKIRDLFDSPQNGLLFCSMGAGGYALITAGVTAFEKTSLGQSLDLVDLFLRDYVGVLMVGPLLILCFTRRRRPLLNSNRGEVLVLTLLILFLTTLLFGPGYETVHPTLRLGIVLLVPLFWVASRFELRISTGLTFLCFLLVLKGTAMGYGIFGVLPSASHGIMRAQVFFGTMSIVLLLTGLSSESRQRAEDKLRGAFENIRQLLDSANVLIVGLNRGGELKLFNRMAEIITGYRRDELPESNWFSVFCPPEGCSEEHRFFYAYGETGKLPAEFETVIRTKDGRRRVVAWQTSEISQPHGEITRICYGMDITERRQGEEELKKSAELIEDLYNNAPCGYHSIDHNGHIVRINQTELNWLGYTREEVIGKHITDLMVPASRGQFKYNFPKMKKEGGLRNLEVDLQCKDGRTMPIAISSTAVYDSSGNFLMSRSTMYDLTERRKVEAKLRQTRNFLDSIIDNIPNMLVVKDAKDLKFLRLNKAGEELLGVNREAIVGKNDYDFFPKEEADSFRAMDREVLGSGQLLDIPEESIHTSKGVRMLHTKKLPVSDEAGQLEYLLSISEDITDVHRAEQELDRFFNLSLNLFCIAGFDGYFKRLNPAWELLLGYSREELMARPLIEFIHPDDHEATHREAINLAEGKELLDFENRYRCKDGTYRWLQWQGRSVPTEGVIYAVAHDCTERKLAEQNLKATTADLKRSNEELEQFAYVASHDLQEPLRMVGSYTMLLGKRYKGQLDADADKFIEYAVNGSKRMQQLIQDLLTYSRVGTKGRPFEAVPMEDVLLHVLESLRMAIHEAQGFVTHDPLPEVYGEPIQLAQVLQNLIGNALKFHGNEPPKIHIAAQRGSGEWIFTVRDNGIGIAPEYSERIFAIFQRLHSRARYEGTGIGLAVCKKIIQRHGGRIWVESQGENGSGQGGGAVFYFTIPDRPRNPV